MLPLSWVKRLRYACNSDQHTIHFNCVDLFLVNYFYNAASLFMFCDALYSPVTELFKDFIASIDETNTAVNVFTALFYRHKVCRLFVIIQTTTICHTENQPSLLLQRTKTTPKSMQTGCINSNLAGPFISAAETKFARPLLNDLYRDQMHELVYIKRGSRNHGQALLKLRLIFLILMT